MWFYWLVLGLLVFRVSVMSYTILFIGLEAVVLGDLIANVAFLVAIWKLFSYYRRNKTLDKSETI